MVRIVTYITISIGLALKLISVGSTWTILPILRGYLALEVKLLILFRFIILSLKYGTAKNKKEKRVYKIDGKNGNSAIGNDRVNEFYKRVLFLVSKNRTNMPNDTKG